MKGIEELVPDIKKAVITGIVAIVIILGVVITVLAYIDPWFVVALLPVLVLVCVVAWAILVRNRDEEAVVIVDEGEEKKG